MRGRANSYPWSNQCVASDRYPSTILYDRIRPQIGSSADASVRAIFTVKWRFNPRIGRQVTQQALQNFHPLTTHRRAIEFVQNFARSPVKIDQFPVPRVIQQAVQHFFSFRHGRHTAPWAAAASVELPSIFTREFFAHRHSRDAADRGFFIDSRRSSAISVL